MADAHHGVHIAAGVEVGLELHPHRIAGRNEVVQDAIGHLLMGDGAVAIAVDVELDRLEFHHPGARLVGEAQHRKVGIARKWAEAGEFRQLDRDLIGASRPGIVKADQLGISDGPLAVEGRTRGVGSDLAQGFSTVVSNPTTEPQHSARRNLQQIFPLKPQNCSP